MAAKVSGKVNLEGDREMPLKVGKGFLHVGSSSMKLIEESCIWCEVKSIAAESTFGFKAASDWLS